MGQQRSYRSALVTGATSGIGAAFADALPPETALLLTGRREARLREAAARHAKPRRAVDSIAADLATVPGREAVIARAEAAQVDLFICNAGAGLYGPFLRHDAAAELESVELNVIACVHLVHALLPGMLARARTGGRRAGLVVVSSRAALGPSRNLATYAAGKAFQLRFTQALARELAQEPVDVLALCPGATDTEFFGNAGAPAPKRRKASPAAVAREALAALGRRTTLFGGKRLHPVVLAERLLR
jgi:short-subunit dehydrogenase